MADLPKPGGVIGQLSTIRLVASGQILGGRFDATGTLATVRLVASGQLEGYTNPVIVAGDNLELIAGGNLELIAGGNLEIIGT